jgi:hypothetical protein
MNNTPRLVLRRRKDRIYLPKSFCERVGLVVTPHPNTTSLVFSAYYIDIPSEYSAERAMRVARQMRLLGRKLKLGHVRNRLLNVSGTRFPPWKRSIAKRQPPLWVQILDW